MSWRMWPSRWHNLPSCRRDRIRSRHRLSKPMACWSAVLCRTCLLPSRRGGRLATSTGPNVVCSGILWSLLAVASTARLKWANRLLTSTPKSARLLLRTDAGYGCLLPRSNCRSGAPAQGNRVVLNVECVDGRVRTRALRNRRVKTFADAHFGPLRESGIKPLPPERPVVSRSSVGGATAGRFIDPQ